MNTTQKKNIEMYRAKVFALQDILSDRIDELLAELGLDLARTTKQYIGCCPVHGGDRRDALRLYRDGHTVRGNWVCYTRHCEAHFQRSLIGFVRGVLSHQQHGWCGPADQKVSFLDTLNYVCSFLGIKLRDVQSEPERREKQRFASRMKSLLKSPQAASSVMLSREVVRQHLSFPAQYYLERGYSTEILDRFDVGLYRHPGRELSNRVVVPIYDDDGQCVVGFTGRSIFEKCETCGFYHKPGEACKPVSKWLNSPKDFNVHSGLYNFWAARSLVRETGTVYLVEGQGDVWRMIEAGEQRVCGLYGSKLTDEQQVVLEKSGAMKVILLLNNDQAGDEGRDDAVRRLRRSYEIVTPRLPTNDLGEMPVAEVKNFLSSIRS